MSTFTAPESGWYHFTPGRPEPEFLGNGPKPEADGQGLVTLIAGGETVGFGNSGGSLPEAADPATVITIPWSHE